jgi:hypothetical protein
MKPLLSFLAIATILLVSMVPVPAVTETFPVDELRPGMVGVGKTVFEGDRLDEFKVHIIGVLRNVIGPRRNLVLAKLEGGPLAHTGVIAGMSGSPVYVDGRLLGAVSYSLGAFSKEPIAGITPIDEMVEATALNTPRRQVARAEMVKMPLTEDDLRESLRQAFSWMRPFAASPSDVRLLGGAAAGVNGSIGTMLRPIATPLSMSGFDSSSIEPLMATFRDVGFVPVIAGGAGQQAGQGASASNAPLRAGDPIGVSLLSGDLEMGATGTVTHVDGTKVYAFGHPLYNLGPTQFPMTRAYVHTVLPSLDTSMKIASTGEVIGTVQQDRATAIAGTLGPGPATIPISLSLTSDRGIKKTFRMSVVNDQLFTPLMTYLSIVETLGSYERQMGAASFVVRGAATVKNRGQIAFEDLFTGDQASMGAASSIMTPINFLLRNAFEDVQIEGVNLEIDASEQPRTATLERVWIDSVNVKPGSTVPLKILLRTYRGDELTRTLPLQIPANARGSVSIMVTDGVRLTQWESRELPAQPAQTRGLPQMIRALNNVRKNNRLYVRLITPDGGAVVKGESLSSLPPSVLAVMESDRNGGSFRPLQSALLGEWELAIDHVVNGSRTLTLALDQN